MSDSGILHCRFCAEQKSDIVDFTNITSLRKDIIEKLSLLDIKWFDLSVKHLPETICELCYHSLDSAHEFLTKIKTSQVVLINLLSDKLKQEDKLNLNYLDSTTYIKTESNCDDSMLYKSEVKCEGLNNSNIHASTDQVSAIKEDTSWNSYPWICKDCSTTFGSMDILREHSKDVHGKCNNFKCADCNASFLLYSTFFEHVRGHREYLALYCQYCNHKFQGDVDNIIHISVHCSGSQCDVCGEFFQSPAELQEHMATFIPSKPKRIPVKRSKQPLTVKDLTCQICNKLLKSVHSLRTHKMMHADRKKDFFCDKCGKSFITEGNLTAHNEIHNTADPQICKICNKSFASLKKLKFHVKTHNDLKPFECDHCHKCFRVRSHLKSHMIVHMDLYPYSCQYCDKKFKFSNVYKNHIVIHTGARPYACSDCNRDFTCWANCNKHMKRKHGTTLVKNVSTITIEKDEDIKEWTEQIIRPGPKEKRKRRAPDYFMEQRARIVSLHKQGHSKREISRRLNVSRNTVTMWIKRYSEGGDLGSIY